MKIRLSHSSQVIGLFDLLDTKRIDMFFEESLLKASKIINNENLKDWELDFNCLYVKGTDIRVAKSTKPYVQDKQKVVGIAIPIPTIDLVDWGVVSSQHINISQPVGAEKYYTSLEVDFTVEAV